MCTIPTKEVQVDFFSSNKSPFNHLGLPMTCPFTLQMPRPAPPKTSSAGMESVWHRSLCAMAMMIVGIPAMRKSAQLPPVANMSSAAMTRSVFLRCGAATVTPTARTSQTNPWSAAVGGRSPRNLAARWESSSVGAASVST